MKTCCITFAHSTFDVANDLASGVIHEFHAHLHAAPSTHHNTTTATQQTCVTPPREPVLPRILITFASLPTTFSSPSPACEAVSGGICKQHTINNVTDTRKTLVKRIRAIIQTRQALVTQ